MTAENHVFSPSHLMQTAHSRRPLTPEQQAECEELGKAITLAIQGGG